MFKCKDTCFKGWMDDLTKALLVGVSKSENRQICPHTGMAFIQLGIDALRRLGLRNDQIVASLTALCNTLENDSSGSPPPGLN